MSLHPVAVALTEAVIEVGGTARFDAHAWPRLAKAIIEALCGEPIEAKAVGDAVLTVVGLLDSQGLPALALELVGLLTEAGTRSQARLRRTHATTEDRAARFARFTTIEVRKNVAKHDAPAPDGTLSAIVFMHGARRA